MYGGNCKRQGKCTSKMIVNDENGMKLLDFVLSIMKWEGRLS